MITMKQLLDTFGQWGFFALHTVLLLLATFLVGLEIECPVILGLYGKLRELSEFTCGLSLGNGHF